MSGEARISVTQQASCGNRGPERERHLHGQKHDFPKVRSEDHSLSLLKRPREGAGAPDPAEAAGRALAGGAGVCLLGRCHPLHPSSPQARGSRLLWS